MFKLFSLTLLQSAFTVASHTFLKMSVVQLKKFEWSAKYFKDLFFDIHFLLAGVFALSALVVWIYLLRNYEFSVAYLLLSVSYIMGLLVAIFVFNETIPATRWVGVVFIAIGVYLVAR